MRSNDKETAWPVAVGPPVEHAVALCLLVDSTSGNRALIYEDHRASLSNSEHWGGQSNRTILRMLYEIHQTLHLKTMQQQRPQQLQHRLQFQKGQIHFSLCNSMPR